MIFWFMGEKNTAILPLEGKIYSFHQKRKQPEQSYFSTRKLLDQKRQAKPPLRTWYVYQALLTNITWRKDRDSYPLLIVSIWLSVEASYFHLLWQTQQAPSCYTKNVLILLLPGQVSAQIAAHSRLSSQRSGAPSCRVKKDIPALLTEALPSKGANPAVVWSPESWELYSFCSIHAGARLDRKSVV